MSFGEYVQPGEVFAMERILCYNITSKARNFEKVPIPAKQIIHTSRF
jgi:hypothetical protein